MDTDITADTARFADIPATRMIVEADLFPWEGEMRKIEHKDLERNIVNGDQYMKPTWCEDDSPGCFINHHGIIMPRCHGKFRWHHDGFKCDAPKEWK